MKRPVVEYVIHRKHKRWNHFFGCPSNSDASKSYTVSAFEYRSDTGASVMRDWACSCPRWTLNASRPECSHIRRVKYEIMRGNIALLNGAIPEAVERFITKTGGAFEAVEITDNPDPRKRRKGNDDARAAFDALEL